MKRRGFPADFSKLSCTRRKIRMDYRRGFPADFSKLSSEAATGLIWFENRRFS